ncbi:MAG: putative Transposable element Tc3 transposase [Streblomastix strix]|uniref:Putative Transposable element Tc3 transposase n=1 Tax=Streblomastix strix TaxID=222440 RepID=A0A5J4W5V1_9EUKA|nr:MAG: putative Transposable element Tc3 transposase [Streblomastix strix]
MVRGVATSKVNILKAFQAKKYKFPAEISRHTGISVSIVKDILKCKTFAIKSARTSLLSERDRRRIINTVIRNCKRQPRCIVEQASLNVLHRTIKRSLKATQIKKLRLRRRPLLWKTHRQSCLEFSRVCLKKRIDWNNTVAEDEKKFCLEVPDGYEFYQYTVDEIKIGDLYSVDYDRKRGVIVWMAESGEGILHVEKVDEKINSDSFCEMISNDTIASIHVKNGDDFLLIQDNSHEHRANSKIQFLQEHTIVPLQFLALSLYLNIIENLWSLIVRRLHAEIKVFYNEEQLWQVIKKIIPKITKKEVNAYVHSMDYSLIKVTQRQGLYTQREYIQT